MRQAVAIILILTIFVEVGWIGRDYFRQRKINKCFEVQDQFARLTQEYGYFALKGMEYCYKTHE